VGARYEKSWPRHNSPESDALQHRRSTIGGMTRAAGPHRAMAVALHLTLEMTALAKPMKARLHAQQQVPSRLAVTSDACVGGAGAVHHVVMTSDAIRIAVEVVGKNQSQARVGLQRNALQRESQERHCESEEGYHESRKRYESHRADVRLVARGAKRQQRGRGAEGRPRHQSPWRKGNSGAAGHVRQRQRQDQKREQEMSAVKVGTRGRSAHSH